MPSFVLQPSSVVSTGVPLFVAATHSLHDEDENEELLVMATEPSTTLFVDMMADLKQITSKIESVKSQVRVRRQRRATVATGRSSSAAAEQVTIPTRGATAAVISRPRRKTVTKVRAEPDPKVRHVMAPTTSEDGGSQTAVAKVIIKSEYSVSSSATNRRKKDEDALDCIYAELQESVGMCRYWGKKCWNLRVPKAKGGFHSLCHFHRVKANDNQRRFDYKRRGTMWRSFKPDPNYVDISLFPGDSSGVEAFEDAAAVAAAVVNFEPFEHPEPLQDQDVALLRELIGSTMI